MKPNPKHAGGVCRCWRDDPSSPCEHCGRPDAECIHAHPCYDRCGAITTPYASCAPGYCPTCAASPAWVPIEVER